MHAFKAGWVGQTFALATHNDSGGKRTRIRRSKEERKSMIETFIKKHQKSNDGNFPSLNLTHKEVGGSFYTVREIVREIIQENRILRPAKMPIEEQGIDDHLEDYPLGSISIEPEPCLSSFSETQIVSHIKSDQNWVSSGDLVESSDDLFHQPEDQIFDNEQEDNARTENAEIYTEFDVSHDIEATSYPLEEPSEGTQQNLNGQLVGPDCPKFDNDLVGKGTLVSDDKKPNALKLDSLVSIHHEEISQELVQESSEDQGLRFDTHFPGYGNLSFNQPAVNCTSQTTGENDIDSLNMQKDGRKQLEASDPVKSFVKPDIQVEKFPLRPVVKKIDGVERESEVQCQEIRTLEVNGIEQDRVHVSKGALNLMNSEVRGDMAGQPHKESEAVDEISCLTGVNSSLGISNSSNEVTELKAKVSSPVETKPMNSSTAFSGNGDNNSKTSFPEKKSISKNSVGVKYKLNIEHNSSSQKGVESRFERVKLETGKGLSKKPMSSEISIEHLQNIELV